MTHTHAKHHGQRSVTLKAGVEINGRTETTDCSTLPNASVMTDFSGGSMRRLVLQSCSVGRLADWCAHKDRPPTDGESSGVVQVVLYTDASI